MTLSTTKIAGDQVSPTEWNEAATAANKVTDSTLVAANISDFDTEVSNNTDVSANTAHKTSTGADHTYINQDVTSGAAPTFSGTNFSGTASSLTAGTVTTNANLTGPITSVGNATSIASQTGTGTKFVVDTSPTLVTPNIGTPSAGTLTSCTGLPISTGVSGLGTNVATFLGTPSSANLISAITDETGTGALVFGTSPTLGSPVIQITGQTVGGSAGDLVYLSGANTWSQTDASAAATCSGFLGINISASVVQVYGPYTTIGLTVGNVYASETAGGIVFTQPTTSLSIVRPIGYALSTTVLFLDPSKTWVENA